LKRSSDRKRMKINRCATAIYSKRRVFATPQARRVEDGADALKRGASCAKGRTDRKRSMVRRGYGDCGAVISKIFGRWTLMDDTHSPPFAMATIQKNIFEIIFDTSGDTARHQETT
jgi:hypothetical protein